MKPVDTKRLRFRELRVSDADGFHAGAFGVPEVIEHLQWSFHETREQTRELIEEMLEQHRREEKYFWIAQERVSGRLVGLGSLKPSQDTVWIGFLVLRGEHRKGYGTELVSALEAVSLLHRESASAAVEASNRASISLLQQACWTEDEDPAEAAFKTFRRHSVNKATL